MMLKIWHNSILMTNNKKINSKNKHNKTRINMLMFLEWENLKGNIDFVYKLFRNYLFLYVFIYF